MVNRVTLKRQTRRRITPTRSTTVRGDVSRQTIPQRLKEQEQNKRNITNIENNVKSFFGTISNINDLDVKSQVFLSNNIDKVPLNLRSDFERLVQENRNTIIKKQSDLKNRLTNSIEVYDKREASATSTAVSDKYYIQAKLARGALSSVSAGSILDEKSTYDNIFSRGELAKKEKQFRVNQRVASDKLKAQLESYQKTEGLKKTQVPSVVQIRDKFGINLDDAKIVRQNIQEDRKGELEALSVSKGISSKERLAKAKESISKENKEIARFIKNFGEGFYDRYANTKATFPSGIQNARNVFFNELNSSEKLQFKKLNVNQKNTILNYSVVKAIQALLPKSSLSVDKETKKVLKARGVELSDSEGKLLYKISFASDKELLELVKKFGVQKFINLYNLNVRRIKAVPKSRSESLMKSIRSELKSLKGVTKLPKFFDNYLMNKIFGSLDRNAGVKLKEFTLNGLDEYLRNEIKEGRGLSQKEYNYWKLAIKDLTGFKRFAKDAVNGTKKDFKKFIETVAFDLSGKRSKTVASYPKAIQNARSLFYGEMNSSEQKKFDKKAIDLAIDSLLVAPKVIGRGFQIASNDLWDLGKLILGLGSSMRKAVGKDILNLFMRSLMAIAGHKRTLAQQERGKLEITKLIIKAKNKDKFLRENPAIVSLAIATGVITLTKASRDLLKNNPKEWFAQVISFFADDKIISGASKGAKLISKLIPKLSKLKVLSRVSDLTKLIKKSISLKFKKTGAFIKDTKIISTSMFRDVPTSSFRFAIKDADGVVKYVDSKGLKKLRRMIKAKLKPYELERDLIFQYKRFIGKQKKAVAKKLSKIDRPAKIRIEKERIKARLEMKSQKAGKMPKAISIKPKVFVGLNKQGKRVFGYLLVDISGNTKIFSSRKSYLNAIKRNFRQINKGTSSLIDRYAKILRNNREVYKSELVRLSKLGRKISLDEKRKIIKEIILNPSSVSVSSAKKSIVAPKVNIPESRKVTVSKKAKKAPEKKSTSKVVYEAENAEGKYVLRKDGTQEIYKAVNVEEKTSTGLITVQKQMVLVETKKITVPQTKEILKTKTHIKYGYLQEQRPKLKTDSVQLLTQSPKLVVDVRDISKVKVLSLIKSVLKSSSVTAIALRKMAKLSNGIVSKGKVIVGSSIKSQDKIKSVQTIKQDQAITQILKIKQIPTVTTKVITKITEVEILKLIDELLPQELITPKKLIELEKILKKKKLILPKLKLEFNWDKEPRRGYKRIVNPVVIIKGKNKELKWQTTENRAKKRINKLIDNTLAQSFGLKIIGLKKVKDIKNQKLSKFREKKTKGSRIIKYVEKRKHAIDTKGEKQGLTLSKALKKKTKVQNGIRKKNTKPRVSNKKKQIKPKAKKLQRKKVVRSKKKAKSTRKTTKKATKKSGKTRRQKKGKSSKRVKRVQKKRTKSNKRNK